MAGFLVKVICWLAITSLEAQAITLVRAVGQGSRAIVQAFPISSEFIITPPCLFRYYFAANLIPVPCVIVPPLRGCTAIEAVSLGFGQSTELIQLFGKIYVFLVVWLQVMCLYFVTS